MYPETLMRPARAAILLILTAFLAGEPVVHTHPLAPRPSDSAANGTPNVCAVCAVGADRIVLDDTAVAPHCVVVDRLVPVAIEAPSADTGLPSSSRAPPAA